MRILFGVLGLLIVVSIVLSVARKQLQAVGQVPAAAPAQVASSPQPGGPTVPQQSQALQQRVANDVQQIMQNAPARAEGQ
jgi:hypothetical protein